MVQEASLPCTNGVVAMVAAFAGCRPAEKGVNPQALGAQAGLNPSFS